MLRVMTLSDRIEDTTSPIESVATGWKSFLASLTADCPMGLKKDLSFKAQVLEFNGWLA